MKVDMLRSYDATALLNALQERIDKGDQIVSLSHSSTFTGMQVHYSVLITYIPKP